MSTIQANIKRWRNVTEQRAIKTFAEQRPSSVSTVRFASRRETLQSEIARASTECQALAAKKHWRDREYREAYLEASIEQGLAWQIRVNRKLRGLSQKDLAQTLGTQQSAISRIEDPEYGAHSLDTLVQIAKAFDCALMIKFVPYSALATESEHLSEMDQYAAPFSLEEEQFNE